MKDNFTQSLSKCSRSAKLPLGVLLAALLNIFGCDMAPKATESTPTSLGLSPIIDISPNLPADIPGGAANAHLTDAATFAWQEFIALNWPAVPQTGKLNTRDTPDKTKKFGDPAHIGQVVWETFRSKVEIFPGPAYNPNGYTNSAALSYGYDALPAYNYAITVPPCNGTAPASVAYINLDEVSQIGLNDMYAGALNGYQPPNGNSNPPLIRFLAKANRTQYNYIAENNFWNFGGNYLPALNTFQNAINSKAKTVPPDSTIIYFPAGTIEVKAAWRLLGPKEDKSRFFTTAVRYYENENKDTCYHQDAPGVWGLIALHIIQKTPTAPYFIFATFEQADNILTKDGKPVEDEDGNIINTPSGNGPTTPGVVYNDPLDPNSITPPPLGVSLQGPLTAPELLGMQLYYKNLQNGLPKDSSGKGNICVNKRYNAIPPAVIRVNKSAHQAIKNYNGKNGIASSPWQYYKLVNVQWKPFNNSQINTTDPNSDFIPSTYYQANIVVETNNTLQQFSGQQIKVQPGLSSSIKYEGVKSNYTFNDTLFYNVHVPNNGRYDIYNMGGCMGCHGNAQVAGTDFSFLLFFGPNYFPEFPEKDKDGNLKSIFRKKYR